MLRKSKSKIADRMSADWPAVATFRREHNHPTSGATVLKHRGLGQESRQRLLSLFRQGHNPSSALHALKTELKIKHGDEYGRISADTYYVPSCSVVHKLRRKEIGSCSGEQVEWDLQTMLLQYCEDSGGMAKFGRVDSSCFVAICSPLMARVHELVAESGKLVMVDVAVGTKDKHHCRMYSFLTPTPTGMLPLGVIISENQTEEAFEISLYSLKSCLPEKSFFGRGSPQVFLIDSDVKERPAVQRVFNNSRILLSHFHTLKTVWAWLCDAKNNIHESHRQDLYSSFRSVLCAETEADMINQHLVLVSSYAYSLYYSFASYYDALWDMRSNWALALHDGLQTTSYAEVTCCIWKDCILDRIMSFSLPQLFGFVTSCYELYMQKRLLDFCNGRYQKSLLKSLMCDKTDVPESTVTVIDERSLICSVKSPDSSEVHTVDQEKATCSCHAGNNGKLCGHSRAMLLMLDETLWNRSQLLSVKTKPVLFRVAKGLEPSPDDALISSLSTGTDSSVNGTRESMVTDTCSDKDNVNDNGSTQVTDEEIEQFCSTLCMQLKEGMQKAPHIIAPTFQQMRAGMAAFSTDARFMNAFQKFTSTRLTPTKYLNVGHHEWQKHRVEIDIRPARLSN